MAMCHTSQLHTIKGMPAQQKVKRIVYFERLLLLLQSEYQVWERLTLIQFSASKTCFFSLFQKFFLFFILYILIDVLDEGI